MMRWLVRLSAVTDRLADAIVVVGMLGVLGIVTLQMVDRHVIDVPIREPDAYARIGLIWLCFVGFASAARAGQAIRVDLLDNWLGVRIRAGLAVAFDLLILATLVVLLVKGWLLVQVGAGQRILGTELNMAYPNMALVAGCAALFIFVSVRILQRLADFQR